MLHRRETTASRVGNTTAPAASQAVRKITRPIATQAVSEVIQPIARVTTRAAVAAVAIREGAAYTGIRGVGVTARALSTPCC